MQIFTLSFNTIPADVVQKKSSLLSGEERARAKRFLRKKDRLSFVQTRIKLRELLGDYLKIDPKSLVFASTKLGKPFLPDYPNVHFNVSHCDTFAVFAIADKPVGIDIEKIRSGFDYLGIAQRFFSPKEREHMTNTATPDEQQKLFFRIWVRKEARLKALGVGIPGHMEEEESDGANQISIQDVFVHPEYYAAVAVVL